ncbi:amidohydrolase family protein [Limimaricola soesokkakensis]|uniref:amidohydrolase family protein n=1 Tax=Limimaricola soesokkakensis TaxID=1343159 RepID=UPI003516EB93
MIIDAHQHFWRLDRGDYGWLTPELAPIFRDFGPRDLAPHLTRHGIGGTVLVQAAPTLAETEYLLELARETDFVRGVVGWVDFEAAGAPEEIARLARHPKLVGLRPMIQDIAEDDWMLNPSLAPAFEAMIRHDLTFDALVLPRHLPRLRELLARHLELRCVIDHGAKPEIARGHFDDWAEQMTALAQETTACCKLSGLLTEAGAGAGHPEVAPYAEHLFAQFSPSRLIWGSDWPVLTLAASYGAWFEMAMSFISDAQDRQAVFGGNAMALYRL